MVHSAESNTILGDAAQTQLSQPRKNGARLRRNLFALTKSGINPPENNARAFKKYIAFTCQASGLSPYYDMNPFLKIGMSFRFSCALIREMLPPDVESRLLLFLTAVVTVL